MGMTDTDHTSEGPLSSAERDAAAAYNAPPTLIPRTAMWNAIAAQRAAQRLSPDAPIEPHATAAADVHVQHTTVSRWWRSALGVALAAAAVVAVVAGVRTRGVSTRAPAAAVALADSTAATVAWDVASTEHFGLAESMLTMVAQSSTAQSDAQLAAWARDLLASTRLLMDSPAGRDPRRRALLDDLELVLVQLIASGPSVREQDRTVIDETLSRSAVLLTRLRTTLPAGVPAQQ
jgi:Mrp family chromosome partitioning ATPase